MIWNVSTPKVCSTTRPTSCDSAPVSARVARASTSRCSRSFGPLQAGQLDVAARRLVAEQQRQDVERLQRRIRRELRLHPLGGAGHAHRDAIGLARHAHARLGFDVEERLDAIGVREIEAAARDQVAAAFELDLAAIDLGVAEQQRPIERAAHGQIGAGDDARLIVVDAQGAGRDQPDVEAHVRGGGDLPFDRRNRARRRRSAR